MLTAYIDAAVRVIEDIVGPVGDATRTVTVNGGGRAIVLPSPAATITSVTVAGVATTDYTADLVAGIVYGGSFATPTYFYPGNQNVVITYTVGNDNPPANVVLAARELVRFWWQQGQQANRPSFGEAGDSDEYTPSGFAVPRRVIELCAPDMRPPGVG
jgi:hypothetical protein